MTKIHLENCKTEYWETEGGSILASVDSMRGSALLILRSDHKSGDDWEILERNSQRWNWFHQCIFRNHRADPISQERIKTLLQLPQIISVSETHPPEFFLTPKTPLFAKTFPTIRNYIQGSGKPSLPIYVVLLEDLYESKFGDGKFLDFNAVCLSC